jgi:hypothetical protein
MKKEWVERGVCLSCLPADLYAGDRKILRQRKVTFTDVVNDLSLEDGSYLKGTKMTLLKKQYFNPESHAAALDFWRDRRAMAKYGSVSFTTYNHLIKGSRVVNGEVLEDRGIGSVFGPCIQAVAITWLSPSLSAVDVFWRTTEWFRKFPADLILIRDHFLPPFKLQKFDITCHFANITMNPLFFVILIRALPDPVASLDLIKSKDPRFHRIVVRQLSRLLSDTPSHFGPEERIRHWTRKRMLNADWLKQYIAAQQRSDLGSRG